jgi:2-polyprenyl-3-methyl-5-hydroxy-6-metoxy-1,4-benzoquinol methylase
MTQSKTYSKESTMTMKDFWEKQYQDYEKEQLPWFIGRPDYNLIGWLQSQAHKPERVLDLGCGHADNAIWLAQQGYKVSASDVSETAILDARKRAFDTGVEVDFHVNDAMETLPQGPFDLVFDRGMFHCFNVDADRAKVVENISKILAPTGVWLSTIGSTECSQGTQVTPPRRSLTDIVLAVEPHLRITSIVSSTEEMFTEVGIKHCSAWFMVAHKRQIPPRPWIPTVSGWQNFK